MIRHKKAEVNVNDERFIFILPYLKPEEKDITDFIDYYQSKSNKVVVLTSSNNEHRLNVINPEHLNIVEAIENIDSLQWEEGIE